MIDAHRRRLVLITSATTKLEAASNLIKASTIDVARLFDVEQRDHVQKIAAEIDAEIDRLALALKEIP